jgi:hypothetical protein
MKNAAFATAFAALFFLVYEDIARAQTEMICHMMCWEKGLFWRYRQEPQVLICRRTYQTDAEGKQWHDLYDSGELADGKLLNTMSSDYVPSGSNLIGCQSVVSPPPVSEVKVTGFAYRAKICGVSIGPPQQGMEIAITVCGVINDGQNANFFPMP